MMSSYKLFSRLSNACEFEWKNFVEHAFVRGLQNGTLSQDAFKYYLIQDYLFLIQFARAYSLMAYKSKSLDDLRDAMESVRVITEEEMSLHIEYCKSWGISKKEIEATPEHENNIAYTRYVLECGVAGDILDLSIALLPCMWGYAEIAKRIDQSDRTCRSGNPYTSWIKMYASNDYQSNALLGLKKLDRLFIDRGGEGRIDELNDIFRNATQLETKFWQMSLDFSNNEI